MTSYKEKLNHINTIILDVDGVLTDGSITLVPSGEMLRSMNVKDGYAMQLAIKKGIKIAVITGGRDKMVVERLKYLGLFDIYTNSHNKLEAFNDLCSNYDLDSNKIIYMGDDTPDIPVMQKVGLATCPKDAVQDVRAVAEYISPFNGGKGCVRDIIEQTLKAQNKWLGDSQVTST